MTGKKPDALTEFLAFLGQQADQSDFAEQVARLQVPEDIRALLLRKDRAGLEAALGSAQRPVPFVRTPQAD
jgi:hypothetical protein